MDDLESFVPKALPLTISGVDFEITPLKIGKVPAFAKAITPAYAHLEEQDYVGAVLYQYEAVREGLVVALDVTEVWLDELDADEFLDLATGVYEVNLDFFARRLLPMMRQSAQRISKAATAMEVEFKEPGAISSPGSSSAGTPSTDVSD